MLVLSILHNVFLSEEQITKLIDREEIHTVGVSVPVWHFEGNTSEPSEEVFCNYTIKNDKNSKQSITFQKDGYIINVPQLPKGYKHKLLTQSQLVDMTERELDNWHDENPHHLNAVDLLSFDKGGLEGLSFRQYTKKKENSKITNLVHTIEISPMKKLINSLC